MSTSEGPQITREVQEGRDEDSVARLDGLVPRVYDELRRIAHRQLRRRRPGETISTTALVHEVYLRLAEQGTPGWRDRTHFLASAATAMRHILIDYARYQQAEKRGGGRVPITLNEALAGVDERAETLLALEDALIELARLSPRLAQIVEYRFFAGLREAEIATVLGVSERTVQREWRTARAWLARALATTASHG